MKSLSLDTSQSSFCEPILKNSISLIPSKDEFGQNYVVHRVKLQSIEVSQEARNSILAMMTSNKSFIQIADRTVMLKTISAIEPLPVKRKQLVDLIIEKRSEEA